MISKFPTIQSRSSRHKTLQKKTSGRLRLGLGCGLLLFLVPASLAWIRYEASKALKIRIKRVSAELEAAEELILSKRQYPFQGTTRDEASRYYRCFDWLASDASSDPGPSNIELPVLERGLWTGKVNDLKTHSRVLGMILHPSGNPERPSQSENDAAQTFIDNHGETLLNLLRRGVRCDHIRWPGSLLQGINGVTSELNTQRCAVNVALFIASQKDAAEAIEIALTVYAFGRDHGLHPTIIGEATGLGIEKLALDSLGRRLSFEGVEPSEKELERIISALGLMPSRARHTLKFEALRFDAMIVKLLRDGVAKDSPARPREGEMSTIPELILWQWRTLDSYRSRLEAAWALPLAEAIAELQQIEQKLHENRSAFLARLAIPSLTELKIAPLQCQAKTDLVRLAAAAQLFRRRTGQWPTSPAQLASQFGGMVPIDPLSEGADYTFEVTADTWTAYAMKIRNETKITLPPQRKANSRG